MTSDRPTRRHLLRGLVASALGSIAGCGDTANEWVPGGTATTAIESNGAPATAATEPLTATPNVEATATVSDTATPAPQTMEIELIAFYYPWYKSETGWLDRVPAEPTLGEYDSEDTEVVHRHLEWSRDAGIDSWCINWAPTEPRGSWIENYFLPAEGSEELGFCMQPATLGRFRWDDGVVDFDDGHNRRVLRDDLQLFERRYFDEPNYLRIEGRPVVYYFAFLAFRGDVQGAFHRAIRALDEDPYIVADGMARGTIAPYEERFAPVDAISPYNPYDPNVVAETDFDEFLDTVASRYLQWSLTGERSGHEFHPSVIPGYNDTEARPDENHPILQRSPERFRRLARVASAYIQADRNLVFLTTFNEWPEYTAIEPAASYGTTYLNLARETLAETEYRPPRREFVSLVFDFNKTIDVVEGPGGRPISLMLGSMDLLDGENEVVSFDVGDLSEEPVFAEGAYPTERNENHDPVTWRWLGGPTATAAMYLRVDSSTVDSLNVSGKPVRNDEIEMDVLFGGVLTDHIELGDRTDTANTYRISLEVT